MPPLEHVSVALPVGQAIERVKRMLFQPFDLGRWITLGFCAWLAQLGQGGSSAHFNYSPDHGKQMEDLRRWLEQARDYVVHNLYWILPLAAVVLLFGVVLWVLILWLSSRGRFMLLHCVALDKAEVAVPWSKFAREANSLFRFRLVLGILSLAAVLPLLAMMAVISWRMIERGRGGLAGIVELVGVALLLVLVGCVLWGVKWLTTEFVVPIMFRRGDRCLRAWGVFLGLLTGNLGRFILYLLFRIVLAIAIAVLVLTGVLVTCCLLGCVLIVPFLGTVLLLPIHVFQRAYSLYYLAQYGPEFDVFAPTAQPGPAV